MDSDEAGCNIGAHTHKKHCSHTNRLYQSLKSAKTQTHTRMYSHAPRKHTEATASRAASMTPASLELRSSTSTSAAIAFDSPALRMLGSSKDTGAHEWQNTMQSKIGWQKG